MRALDKILAIVQARLLAARALIAEYEAKKAADLAAAEVVTPAADPAPVEVTP